MNVICAMVRRCCCTLVLVVWGVTTYADVIDFESMGDGDPVSVTFSGVEFSNATVVRAGLSLNDLEFPPRSGEAVAFDDGGVMLLSFAAPIDLFKGFVTYRESIMITAFDSSNAVVATSTTLFGSNLALSGDAGSQVNEALQLAGSAIQRIQIAGNPAGGSFVLDDVTFRLARADNAVPEPTSLLLWGAAFVAAAAVRRTGNRRRKQVIRLP